MPNRKFNFSAGPAMLPEPVMARMQAELLDWQGLGVSVMELGHRTSYFKELAAHSEQSLRQLLNINDDYAVLFLLGGARVQFAMLPMNILGDNASADYFDTGMWSQVAIKEAQKYCQVNIAASAKDLDYRSIPSKDQWQLNPDAAYVHYTHNETIIGVEFPEIPDVGSVPLVSDMTSCLLNGPLDVSRYGVIYAGAQKNLGIAGLTIAIVRRDLLGKAMPTTPTVYDYQVAADTGSAYSTPPTFPWYVASLMFDWMLDQGGLQALGEINQRKAAKLYQYIDDSDFYHNNIDKPYRSQQNVSFTLSKPELDDTFLVEADANGLAFLKGHRSNGGMRASIYNAMPESAVDVLIDFMINFSDNHSGR